MLDRTINRYHVLVPVEGAKELEEFLEELPFSLDSLDFVPVLINLAIVVENVNYQSVESVGGHARQLGPEKRRLIGEPRFHEHDGPLEKVVLLNDILVKMVNKIHCAQTTMLADGYVDHHTHEIHFDDFYVCLIDQYDVGHLRILLRVSLMFIYQP